jgi:AraC-like DNA-binding protein
MPKAKSKTPTSPIGPHEIPALNRGMKHIRDHFAQCPRVTDIAAAAGMSPFYFHRRFRLHFGRTPLEVRVGLQIGKAKRLMLAGVPLGEVATRCGFCSHQHFTSRFKRLTGQTPSRWLQVERHVATPRKEPLPRQRPGRGADRSELRVSEGPCRSYCLCVMSGGDWVRAVTVDGKDQVDAYRRAVAALPESIGGKPTMFRASTMCPPTHSE